jgi:hypothetical protein
VCIVVGNVNGSLFQDSDGIDYESAPVMSRRVAKSADPSRSRASVAQGTSKSQPSSKKRTGPSSKWLYHLVA